MWYNQMHCKQKHLNFKTRYIATYIKEAHNLASLFFVILRQNTSSSYLFTWPSPCVCWTSGLIALDHPWPVVSDSTKGSLGGESCYSQSYDWFYYCHYYNYNYYSLGGERAVIGRAMTTETAGSSSWRYKLDPSLPIWWWPGRIACDSDSFLTWWQG